jgi:hypothetical protein
VTSTVAIPHQTEPPELGSRSKGSRRSGGGKGGGASLPWTWKTFHVKIRGTKLASRGKEEEQGQGSCKK